MFSCHFSSCGSPRLLFILFFFIAFFFLLRLCEACPFTSQFLCGNDDRTLSELFYGSIRTTATCQRHLQRNHNIKPISAAICTSSVQRQANHHKHIGVTNNTAAWPSRKHQRLHALTEAAARSTAMQPQGRYTFLQPVAPQRGGRRPSHKGSSSTFFPC